MIEISDELGIHPDDLMAVMAFESHLDPQIVNTIGATGLIQFMPISLAEIKRHNPEIEDSKLTQEYLLTLSDIEQLEYVRLHYLPFAGKLETMSDIYLTTLAPSFVGMPDDTPMWFIGEDNYKENAGLDINEDDIITKGEATQAVMERRAEFEKKGK